MWGARDGTARMLDRRPSVTYGAGGRVQGGLSTARPGQEG
jgi:hypothetical protein